MANVITDELLKAVAKELGRAAKYGAIGTGGSPLQTDTQLALEGYKKMTTYFTDNNTCIVELFLDETEANDMIYTNAGIYYEGDINIGTGKLIAGSDVTIEKNAAENVTVTFELTFTRGV